MPNNPVIATVDGAKIFRSDIDLARAQLPEQFRSLPMDQIFTPLVNQLIRSKLIATRARATKLDTSVLYKRRLALLKDRLLGEMLLDKMIGDRVDEEALRARYRETIAKLPSREEIRARHILVKTKDEALSIVKELIAGTDFAALAVANQSARRNRVGRFGLFWARANGHAIRKSGLCVGQGRVYEGSCPVAFWVARHKG